MSVTITSQPFPHVTARTRWATTLAGLLAIILGIVMMFSTIGNRAFAAESPVGLGTAATYSVLGGQTVTNTGPTTLDGDLGVSPGTAITGFPPGVAGGTVHAGDSEADQAKSDLVIAYNDAAGRAPIDNTNYDTLGGRNLVAGVYNATSTMGLTGTVTLNGGGRTDGVWIFQVGSALNLASDSTVDLTNGADACNVFWQVGSSANLGTGSAFVGTVMALTSISVQTNAVVEGRALARNGSVTLDSNVFTGSDCDQITPSPSDSSSPTATDTPTASESATESGTPTASDTATASESATESATPTASDTATASESATESASPTATESESATQSPTETQSESATESATETQSASATESELATESEFATESTTGTGGGPLAGTGSSGPTTLLIFGGLALLLLGGVLLARGRIQARQRGRHQG